MPRNGKEPRRPEAWREALERAQLGVWDWDLRTGDCFYSSSWSRMLGYEDGELPKDSDLWVKLAHPDDRERAVSSGDRHIAGLTENIETELRLKHKNGHWVWVLDRGGVAERDAAGRPVRVIGVQTDITKQKAAEYELERINARFQLALAASGTGIWHHDIASHRSFWDRRTREIFGVPAGPQELPPETWHSLLHPEDREKAEHAHSDPHNWRDLMSVRYRIVRPDGEVRHIETFARYMAEAGQSGLLVGTSRDVTEEVKSAEALQLEKERLRVTLGSINDAVLSADTAGQITFANRAATVMLQRPEAELLGRPVSQVLGPAFASKLDPMSQRSQVELLSLRLDSSTEAALRCTASPIRCSGGASLGTVYTLQDVTEEIRRQRELAHVARHDGLTGLLNRSAFDDLLVEWVRSADKASFAVLYIDLDHFKALNDFAGHAAGDKALRSISKRLSACLPSEAKAARLGGDEFAVLLPVGLEDEAKRIALEILSAIREADLGTGVPSRSVGASIGIALISDSAISPSDALACADDACYSAKAAGRNRCAVFSYEGASSASGLTAARIVADLMDAAEDGRLVLFGQEIHALGAEAQPARFIEVLTRLTGKDGAVIPPAAFIPAAERFGVAPRLDRWIIKAALTKHGRAMKGPDGLSLGLNLSAQTLSDPHLWEFVDTLIGETEVPYRRIVFEITETAAVTSFEAAERFVRNARERGCRVSLDDFGAGLSSFEYLRRFPVDCIKINGTFVQSMSSQRFDREIVASISGIAKSLGYSVVAEKIEDPAALQLLRNMGVQYGQGFLLHKPEPLEQLVGRLSAAGPVSSRAA